MTQRRRGAETTVLVFLCVSASLRQTACVNQRPPLARAAEYLWSQQAADGGWHSRTYGLLRSGQSLTPFVLDALLEVEPLPSGKVERALAFIRNHTRPDGAMGLSDPDFPDYPNYATALAVKVLARQRMDTRQMVAYLLTQQFTEQNGWRPEDPAYGAWGMGGERRTPPDTGHVDLSMTRLVLEALRADGVPSTDPLFSRALVYVERCQNPDGGFHFTTTEFDTNKAGHDGERFRSYGTATTDGILALRAIGVAPADPRLTGATQWLTVHHRGREVPGFTGEAYQRWPQGLAFYYAAGFAQAMGKDAGIGQSLRQMQRRDGSWSNPNDLVKEDDPLIATPFAMRAMAAGGLEYSHGARELSWHSGRTHGLRSSRDRAAPEAPRQGRSANPADPARRHHPGPDPGDRE